MLSAGSKDDYSEKEQKLFEELKLDIYYGDIPPATLYNMAAMNCFMENRQDKVSESVRRCVKAWHTCSCYRMTPEWDAMIEF